MRSLGRTVVALALGAALLAVATAVAPRARAQAPSGSAASVELEQILFVQAPEQENGRKGIVVLWIPQPIQRLCIGKTARQCASIDYCIRTTSKSVSTCRDLGIPLSSLPAYPRGMRPSRQLSVVYYPIAPITGFDLLKDFYRSAPRASLERLSMSARIKAHIRFTRKPDDDDFDLVDVLAVAPF